MVKLTWNLDLSAGAVGPQPGFLAAWDAGLAEAAGSRMGEDRSRKQDPEGRFEGDAMVPSTGGAFHP